MKDIEKLIREARVQRSAAIGIALGEALGDAWLAVAAMLRSAKVPAAASPGKALPRPLPKALPAR